MLAVFIRCQRRQRGRPPQPMPYPHRTTTPAGLDPVPVAVLLPPPRAATTRVTVAARRGQLSVHAAAQLVAVYTRRGELVADLDSDPALAAAAGWLDRPHRGITGHGWAIGARGGQLSPRRAQLLVAALPRPGAATLASMTRWMGHARARLITPGGHLLVIVAAATRPGRPCPDHATTIVAAAHAAGWVWQQQLIDVTEPLPEHEPAAEPATAATASVSRLHHGRHRVAHQELLMFTTTTAGVSDA